MVCAFEVKPRAEAKAEHNYLSDHYLPFLFNLFFLCLLFPSKQTEAVPKFQLHFSDVCAVGWEAGALSAEESRLGMAADVPNSYSFSVSLATIFEKGMTFKILLLSQTSPVTLCTVSCTDI